MVFWFSIALVILGAEMVSGTIYLLACCAGAATAALAAWAGFSMTAQCLAAGIVTAGGVVAAYYGRRHIRRLHSRLSSTGDPDAGRPVTVTEVATDGSAAVMYRGARWQAVSGSGEPLTPGLWQIAKIDGPRLILTRSADHLSQSSKSETRDSHGTSGAQA